MQTSNHKQLLNRIKTITDQSGGIEQIDDEFKESKDRYARLSKNLQVVLYAAFPDKLTSPFFVSDQVVTITGYPAEQFRREGGLFSRLIHPEDLEFVADKTLKAIEQQKRLRMEYRIVTTDEKIRWIRDKATPILTREDGMRFEGFIEDITEARNAEIAIKAAYKRWQDTFDAMKDPLAVLDEECRILQCNQALIELTGKTKDEILGLKCWEAIHSTMGQSKDCPCPKVKKSLRRETGIINIKDKTYEVTADPQLDDDGKLTGFIHVMSDITERDKNDRSLREARHTFITILDSIDAIIYAADMKTHEILFMNRNMIDTFKGDFTGKICWEAFRKKEAPCGNCTNDKLLDDQGKPTGAYVWEGYNNSTCRWHLNYDRAIRWIDGRYARLQVSTDITQLKKLEQERHHTEAQLRQAQKMEAIGTLAGGIAHDFNNILSAILGYSELALDDALNGRTSAHYIRQILKAGSRARDLVQQILTFSRQTETEAKPIQVKPIIKEALKLLRASLPSTIEIRPNIESESIVEADPIQVHQVIMNLCTNAWHAMRETGGILTVTLINESLEPKATGRYSDLPAGDYLKIEVSDTGTGIDPSIIDKIFDPYFTTKQKDEGTGMGLAVVQAIVQGCNGAVFVQSVREKGASFITYLPVIHTVEPSETKLDVIIPGGNERILFVDDEPPLAQLSKQLLERLGYKVTIRTSSIEALALFESQPDAFDLVITDMTMPHITGDKLAKKIMALRNDMPVIICTGYSEKVTQELMEQLKIKALILKPIIRNELLLTVRQVLDDAKS